MVQDRQDRFQTSSLTVKSIAQVEKSNDEKRRREMVTMVRCGHSIREVARKFGVSRPTVQCWVERANGKRLDRTCFHDLSSAPKRVANRVSIEVERKVLTLRAQLRDESGVLPPSPVPYEKHCQGGRCRGLLTPLVSSNNLEIVSNGRRKALLASSLSGTRLNS